MDLIKLQRKEKERIYCGIKTMIINIFFVFEKLVENEA